jgi:hypothetical protein
VALLSLMVSVALNILSSVFWWVFFFFNTSLSSRWLPWAVVWVIHASYIEWTPKGFQIPLCSGTLWHELRMAHSWQNRSGNLSFHSTLQAPSEHPVYVWHCAKAEVERQVQRGNPQTLTIKDNKATATRGDRRTQQAQWGRHVEKEEIVFREQLHSSPRLKKGIKLELSSFCFLFITRNWTWLHYKLTK